MKESNKYGTIIYLLIKNVEIRWNSERNVYQIIYMYIICILLLSDLLQFIRFKISDIKF